MCVDVCIYMCALSILLLLEQGASIWVGQVPQCCSSCWARGSSSNSAQGVPELLHRLCPRHASDKRLQTLAQPATSSPGLIHTFASPRASVTLFPQGASRANPRFGEGKAMPVLSLGWLPRQGLPEATFFPAARHQQQLGHPQGLTSQAWLGGAVPLSLPPLPFLSLLWNLQAQSTGPLAFAQKVKPASAPAINKGVAQPILVGGVGPLKHSALPCDLCPTVPPRAHPWPLGAGSTPLMLGAGSTSY